MQSISQKWADPVGVGGGGVIELREAQTEARVRTIPFDNRMVNVGLELIAQILRGVAPIPSLFVIGSGTNPAVAGDTDLQTPLLSANITQMSSANGILTVRFFLGSTQGNGNTYSEAGIKNSAGVLMGRFVHTGYAKTASVTATYIWTIPFLNTGS